MSEINEVKLNGETLLSTRSNTVTEDTLVQGETAQNKAGESIEGRLDPVDKDKAYLISDEIGDIDNADYMPFYDVSDQKKKKTLFGSIVEKLKSVFAQKTDLKAHTFEVGTEIPANADLNNYTTVGVYQCLLDSTAQTISNTPYSDTQRTAFKLIVLALRKSQNVMQIFIPYISNHYGMAGKIAYRTYDSSWGQWNHIASTEAVHYLAQPDLARQITANEDLNDYTESGTYQCNNAKIAKTLLNCPVTQSFKLVVDRAYVDTHSEVTQRITCQNVAELDWYRTKRYYATTWGAWKQLASTDDITPSTVGNGYAVGTVSGSAITATISGFKLRAGVIVAIKIPSEITTACTLNINSTGAKNILTWDGDVSFGESLAGGNKTYTFMYDGTQYRVLSLDATPRVLAQNYVADTSGNILMDWGYASNRAQIKHILGQNKLSWNYYKNSAWRGDVKIADFDDLITQLGTQIPENSDLDDYTTAGVYRVQTGTIASTISNIPLANSGKLIVMVLTGYSNDWLTQIYIPNHNDGIYRRRLSDNTGDWSSWINYVNDNDVGASIAKVGKSILPSWSYTSNTITSNGITFTFNPSTGEITANGTATANADCVLAGVGVSPYVILKGSYTLSGCPSGGSSSTYMVGLNLVSTSVYDYGNEVNFTVVSDNICNHNEHLYIRIHSGQTVSNLVFKPMLRPAFTTADYEPCEDIHKGNCYVGTCTTAGATKDKVAYVDGYFVLRKGVRVAIKFSNTNTYSSTTASPVTLNVNGTGAKNIWFNTTHSGAGNTGTYTTIYGVANLYYYYVYDGTYWVWDGRTWDNDTTDPRVLGFGYGTCATAEATTAKVVTLSNYTLRTGGYVSVKFTYAVPANSTMNINSRGAKNIWYRGANITANVIKAGDLATFIYDGTRYQLVGIDRDSTAQKYYVVRDDVTWSAKIGSNYNTTNWKCNIHRSGNILIGSMEIATLQGANTIVFPAYSNSSTDVFCRFPFHALAGYFECIVTIGTVTYPAFITTGTINGTQYTEIVLRNNLTITKNEMIKVTFVAFLEND